MKKKSLIISTIVMMLVVVVALSTATYAWFAVSADAKISALSVQTAASEGLEIAADYTTMLPSVYGGGTGAGTSGSTQYGTMTLDTGNFKKWNGDSEGMGPELLFETGLSGAFGVTGDGLIQNMYTAASRSVTSYETLLVDEDWWDVTVDPATGKPSSESGVEQGDYWVSMSYRFYMNENGTVLAAGDNFSSGSYSGDPEEAKTDIVEAGLYIRVIGFATLVVDTSNLAEFAADADVVYYEDQYGLTLASGANFTDGKYSGSDAATDLTNKFVRKIQLGQVVNADDGQAVIDATPGMVFYNDKLCRTVASGEGFDEGVYAGGDTTILVGKYYQKATPNGEIEKSWTYEENSSALGAGTIPHYLVGARVNQDYFHLNFILQAKKGMTAIGNRTNIADIFMKTLEVTASGGMAASARIALFEFSSNAFDPANGVALRQVFVPFAESEYADATWNEIATNYVDADKFKGANATPPARGDNLYKKYPKFSQLIDGRGFPYGAAENGAFPMERVRLAIESIRDTGGIWQTANFFSIDKNDDWSDITSYFTAQNTRTTQMLPISAFRTVNTIKYYQLVIWFEGTDPECFQDFAGTGVNVNIAFDYFQRFATSALDASQQEHYSSFATDVGFVADYDADAQALL